jgi:hypothetical protein
MIIVDVKKFANVIEDFGRIIDKNLTDFFNWLLIALVDKLVVVLTVQIFLIDFKHLIKFKIVRFETSPYPFISLSVPSIMLSIMFQF